MTGGIEKHCQVELDPNRLRAIGVTWQQVEEALKKSNMVGAGGELRRGGQELPAIVRAEPTSLQDLEAMVVAVRDGMPVRIRDIASVRFGSSDRLGSGGHMEEGKSWR